MGLVIVVSGLNVRDVELGSPDVSDGVGVIEGSGKDVEGDSEGSELLSPEVVDGGAVDGGSVLEGGCSRVVVLGGSLVGGGEGTLSVQISGRIQMMDLQSVRSVWQFGRGSGHYVGARNTWGRNHFCILPGLKCKNWMKTLG